MHTFHVLHGSAPVYFGDLVERYTPVRLLPSGISLLLRGIPCIGDTQYKGNTLLEDQHPFCGIISLVVLNLAFKSDQISIRYLKFRFCLI